MKLFGELLLPLIVFLPALGALVLAFLPKEESDQHRGFALVTTLFTFLVSLGLLWRFEVGVAGFQESLTIDVPWIESLGVRFHMAVDGISLFLILLTTFLTPIVVLSAFNAVQQRTKEFMIALLALETGMLGAFVAVDLVLFYVFWEAMLIPMYLLIGVWGGPRRIYSAVKFFLYTMVGSLLMLLAIIYLYFEEGTFDFGTLLTADLSLYQQRWLFWAFVVAFAVKVPLFPVHTWLPDAHVEAPTAGSVILAGVLLKMGSYGLMRFAFPLFPEAASLYASTLGIIAVIGIVYGALMAIAQSDVKKLIAYSSVSHMGFVILGLCVLTTKAASGAVYQMLNHGISSGGLFLLVGIVYERRHTRLVSDFGGIAKVMPAYAAFFLLVALSSAGLPGTNGFVGEFLILLGSFTAAPTWARIAAAVGGTGVILGAVYLLWMYRRVFFGPLASSENKKLKDLTPREWMVLTPLAVIILWMGLYPKPFLDRINPTAEAYVGRVLVAAAPDRAGNTAVAKSYLANAMRKMGMEPYMGPGVAHARPDSGELAAAVAVGRAWNRPRSAVPAGARPAARPTGRTPSAAGADPQPVVPPRPVPPQLDIGRPRVVRPGVPDGAVQPGTVPPPAPGRIRLPRIDQAQREIFERIRKAQQEREAGHQHDEGGAE